MTTDELAAKIETVKAAIVKIVEGEVKRVDGNAKVLTFNPAGNDGRIWSGLFANDDGVIHTWIVSFAGIGTPQSETIGGQQAPAGCFWAVARFRLDGYKRMNIGTNLQNGEIEFQAETARLFHALMTSRDLGIPDDVLSHTGARLDFSIPFLADNKRAYRAGGELAVVLQPIGR